MILIIKESNFLYQRKIIVKLKWKKISISVFCYEKNKLTYPIYVSDQTFENSMDLLLISNENESHYLYIKDFDRLIFSKTKSKNKKYFCKSCLQCFSNKNVLTEHKKIFLKINGEQAVKLEGGFIKCKKFFSNKYRFHSNFVLILGVF